LPVVVEILFKIVVENLDKFTFICTYKHHISSKFILGRCSEKVQKQPSVRFHSCWWLRSHECFVWLL